MKWAAWALVMLAGGGLVAATARSGDESTEHVTQPTAASGIAGTPHDFTRGRTGSLDLCLPCHTPHITAAQAPLRVARPPAGRPLQPYQMPGADLDSASLLCLSCHDGVVASDVYAGAHGAMWTDRTAAAGPVGRNRLTNHPVGTEYPLSDPKYHSPEAVSADGRILLKYGRMQCTTCHDPHNTNRHAGMLVISNERSRLCLACHRL